MPALVDDEVNLMALGEHAHSFPGTGSDDALAAAATPDDRPSCA
ncbi:hypothetical protein [Lentzea flaviverrucosa]|nr:hypothetical protein [Lentzea flaviverrucosa]